MNLSRCSITLLGFVVLGACSHPDALTVVARVGPQSITVGALKQSYRMQEIASELPPPRTPQETEQFKRELLEALINHHLLLQAADRSGTAGDETLWQQYLNSLRHGYEPRQFKEQLRARGLSWQDWERSQREKWQIQNWITTEIQRHNGIPLAAMKTFYEQHPLFFQEAEKVRARHIVVASRNEAEEVLHRLQGGEPFAELARQFSIGPEAAEGGDLGYFTRKDYPPAFTETCFALPVGEYSSIVPSDYGFHLFQVLDRTPQRVRTFAEVKREIERLLLSQKVKDWMEATLAELKAQTPIEIETEVLRKLRL